MKTPGAETEVPTQLNGAISAQLSAPVSVSNDRVSSSLLYSVNWTGLFTLNNLPSFHNTAILDR